MRGPTAGTPDATPSRGLNRRRFLQASAALAGLPLACRVPPPAAERRPNILFVLSDSHRASSTGCYGDTQARTPAFDVFAGQGLRLTTAISNTPVCRPYRASLMSGLYAHHHGLLANDPKVNFGMNAERQWVRPDLTKLAETFGAAGYRCGYVGKWHLGPTMQTTSRDVRLGFDDLWYAAVNPHEYDRWTYVVDDGSTVTGTGPFRPVVEVDQALGFIAANHRSALAAGTTPPPWLLVLSWGPPHEPLEPPREFLEHFPFVEPPPNVHDEQSRALAAASLPAYYALIEGIDTEFARLMAGLDALGFSDDTLVIYTSDHGNQMFSQDMSGKSVPYSESTRVPFLARWPGHLPAGRSLAMPFGAPDIAPTLMGLAGLDVPAGLDGGDFSQALLGIDGAPTQDHVYLSAYDVGVLQGGGWRGIRTERHLFARKHERPWMLYDVADDPYEQRNLLKVDKPLRKQLDERTLQLMSELGDGWR